VEATRRISETAESRPQARPRDRQIGSICALLLLIGLPFGWLSDASTSDVVAMSVAIVICLVLIAWLITRFVPRERARVPDRTGRTGLIFGVLAFLGIAVFWSGLPFPLGATALAFGLAAREKAPPGGRGKPTAAIVLGALGVLASFVALIVG
jgi:hypothetical protein